MTASVPAPALLLVFAEVGSTVSESAFHDWYDNEHIPLRTALPGFLSATRLVQADNQAPSWGAIYDLTSLDYLKNDAYTNLAKTRSPREADILAKLAFLERRIYTLNASALNTVSSEFTGHKEGQALVIVSFDVPPSFEGEFHRWYDEEHIPLLQKVPGWLRSRRYILAESGANGSLKEGEGYKAPPKFIAIHEYASIGEEGLDGPEWKAARSTPWRTKVFENVTNAERRVMKVFKSF